MFNIWCRIVKRWSMHVAAYFSDCVGCSSTVTVCRGETNCATDNNPAPGREGIRMTQGYKYLGNMRAIAHPL